MNNDEKTMKTIYPFVKRGDSSLKNWCLCFFTKYRSGSPGVRSPGQNALLGHNAKCSVGEALCIWRQNTTVVLLKTGRLSVGVISAVVGLCAPRLLKGPTFDPQMYTRAQWKNVRQPY